MSIALEVPADSDLLAVRGDGTNMVTQMLRFRTHEGRLREYARLRETYGDLSLINNFGVTSVVAQGPDAAEQVLVNRERAFANAPAWGYFIGPFFERGVMLMDFDEHHAHRRVMQSAFGRQELEGYLARMVPTVQQRLRRWSSGPDFRVQDNLKELTLDIALDVFVGVHLTDSEAARLNKAFIAAVRAGASIVRKPVPGLGWDRGLKARKVLEEFFHTNIGHKRSAGGDDLFANLCRAQDEDGNTFTDDDVVNHMIFVLMAAHDTSTITMTTMAYYLARHPEWQQRLRDEADSLEAITSLSDLDALPLLDQCMKEALRLHAPVPVLPRQAVKDTVLLGHHVPAGTSVIVPLYANHYDPAIWPEPHRFDPDRFSDERREDKAHRLAWEPFGGGVHKCIGLYFGGMEVKATFHQLLREFSWSVPDDYRWPLDLTALPVVKDGLPVHLNRI
ncbi:cytochrome P450 [Nocardioides stalactiti]|uniref:cytochrome P450 n=1 Tax=Nocardioides stalactiti TaxID=2755356 RepID=UPI001603F8FB|nr:cytochrome P450 [Nocardioides stalactiti]